VIGFGKPRQVAEPTLRGLSVGVIEAALHNCGYEDVQVDLALFQYERNGVFVYMVATGTCDADAVHAVVCISRVEETGELIATLINQKFYEEVLEEKPKSGPHLPGKIWR
jgi:hypothetical protein